jgi:hypothetical protein
MRSGLVMRQELPPIVREHLATDLELLRRDGLYFRLAVTLTEQLNERGETLR